MAAPRASSFKALRNLQKASQSTPAKRGLHITGVNSFSPTSIDPAHRTILEGRSLQDLRGECQKRTLSASGTKHELIDRLAGHDSLQARAFSMAMRRVSRENTKKKVNVPSDTTPRREFNTSRSLKAVGDTSTIDFAFLPKLFETEWGPQPAAIRVPILPHIDSDDAEAVLDKYPQLDAAAGGYQDTKGHQTAMKPQIEAVHGDSASAMSDVHDGHHAEEMSVEMLTGLTETVGKSARQFADQFKDKDETTIRKLWAGLLDDILGPKKS